MTSVLSQNLWRGIRNATPGFSLVFLVFVTVLPYRAPEASTIIPPLAVMAVYYWGIYRPDLLPKVLIFLVGIFHDALVGGPLGMWALIYLAVHAVMTSQRRFFLGKKFTLEWVGFILFVPPIFAAIWLVGLLFVGLHGDLSATVLQAVVIIVIYPVLAWLMGRVRQSIGGI